MNPRQRRGMLLLIVAIVGGMAILFGVTAYVSSVNSRVGPEVTVLRFKSNLKAYTTLSADDFTSTAIPRRWADPHAISDPTTVTGRKLAVATSTGSTLTAGMLVPASDQAPDERDITIEVDPVTGMAGGVQAGNSVDVYAVYAKIPGLPDQVRVLVRNVPVKAVGGVRSSGSTSSSGNGAQQFVPITLSLNPSDSLAVTYASAFAQELRVVRLPAGVPDNGSGKQGIYDANQLGGKAVPEGQQ
ncbi:Flp pilus assembly protein CpaB [Leekyejoonella antrihumi]|uniref:Flp pilus assembly protein CpaB n=1 Tax=Leekyejoonella antrihumi TaxID=1660198 RepID=A0A563E134_9MICO|nr:Flp pilus assembly protein CpaB [Leekyejoonella antrihumi]TWP35943.1 Flp pilus assembly protein CpaB [Leekyejoonella antrihumi]